MNIAEIESELQALADAPFDPQVFAIRFLEIYNAPKATLTKLRQGTANYATKPGDLLWKNKFFFRICPAGKAAVTVDDMMRDPLVKLHKPRIIFATDGLEVHSRDIKNDQTFDAKFKKLNEGFLFYLPLAGIERFEAVAENPADIKATARIAKLYDAILQANPDWIDRDHTHELNLFMTRMLFCLFAESTSIFERHIFTNTVINRTAEDGSDTHEVIATLFKAMNTPKEKRGKLPEYTNRFEYVNGNLFRDDTSVPKFSKRARRLLKECGELDWKDINPDIFGSMIQAVAQPGLRDDIGLHYTSVPNIMKVLQPLFLSALEEEFEAARDNEARQNKLLQKIYNIRVFDPACGSGNFLIIAYKELRKLEMRIFERQRKIARQWSLAMTGIRLNHFFGIELTDFAAETAKLSLWIAEYQMNEHFKEVFGKSPPALPLRDCGDIVQGNSTRIDWTDVCPVDSNTDTYIVGNPPYLGSRFQSAEQKDDMRHVFAGELRTYKDLDYVCAWYLKSAEFCRTPRQKCALVTTNSVCQGEQVAMLWPLIFRRGIEIGFAHQSFKWKNSAAKNAGVTCIVVGLRLKEAAKKFLFFGEVSREVRNIGPYLIEMDDLIVRKSSKSISHLSKMDSGNKATDGGHFFLTPDERNTVISAYPQAAKLLRRVGGAHEFIRGSRRWCLWIEDENLALANSVPPIASRIEAVRRVRKDSKGKQANDNEDTPHKFVYIPHRETDSILVPVVTSEKRKYIPCGFFSSDTVIIAPTFAVYDASEWAFSIISSRLHQVWAATVGGQHETRIRYSNTLVYNTFPVPDLSESQKLVLEDHAASILEAREAHPGKTIAWLYDPETMPKDLAAAHAELDDTLETIYIGRPFKNDTERLENLFKRYALKVGKVKQNEVGKPKLALSPQEKS